MVQNGQKWSLCVPYGIPYPEMLQKLQKSQEKTIFGRKMLIFANFCLILAQFLTQNGLKMVPMCFLWNTQPRNVAKIAKKVKKTPFLLKNAHFFKFLQIFDPKMVQNGPKM